MRHSAARPQPEMWDVIIVGAGPAGLSAALILARCCRRVLLCDRGTPRSWASKAMHGFLTHEGMPPAEFAATARAELQKYPNVSYRPAEVQRVVALSVGFAVSFGLETVQARKLLIATGVIDELPPVEGIHNIFGISAFQCPYCDGWEFRDQSIAIYGKQQRGLEMARALTAWSNDIVLCSDGPSDLRDDDIEHLTRNGVRLMQQRITRFVSDRGVLSEIVFDDGSRLSRQVLFFDMPSSGQSDLTAQLGCRFNDHGGVHCGDYEATSVPGVYVAGNIIRNVQLSIVAAAEGANAAFGINRALTREDFNQRATGVYHLEHTAPTA
jgi:thioredoxin reductase